MPAHRFAPRLLEQLRKYGLDLAARVSKGWLTQREARILYNAKAAGAMDDVRSDPRRVDVSCRDCGAVASVIGSAQTWRCRCSPVIERSVWDNRRT